ncbi:hypothetical protein C0Z01_02055 [Photobacterium kishitanii]|uniref:hypothetical protein n=1 Tax=Photobacterium kishitanii TaxID=318456 RepID=UPI0004340725|nr:hypothetical protein [Photobacterium kishitanii]OBU21562.1 hypothetical protein AYY22_07990 [Photobacterium kishitanii]PSU97173.1 hypothetical protein C0W35_01955 [Photobacterium kishitanii]PSV21719.1 hypothetical protein C0W28_07870 [Photobacterium kishitanii]PSW71281.1 hypothetical protein C0Z01_02055 [Photobacterium kishitanii]CEO39765.1 conserved exported hypothetical protein [Photobacterium kishitanii]
MNKSISALLVLLALSGWITGGIFSYYSKVNDDYVTKMAGENAFNIIEQSLKNNHTEADILAQIQKWKKDGWTAQTGSIITLCNLDPQKLVDWVGKNNITKICHQAE